MNAEFGGSDKFYDSVQTISCIVGIFRSKSRKIAEVGYGKCDCVEYRRERLIERTVQKN